MQPRCARAALQKLLQHTTHTVYWHSTDMRIPRLSKRLELIARAMRSLRYQAADARHDIGREPAHAPRCPWGCVNADGEAVAYSWQHVHFVCKHCELSATSGRNMRRC